MDEIISFLEENYVYAVGIGLLIIIMLIGFLASRRKAKKKDTTEDNNAMVNINDVNTGEINQVADNLMQKEMNPVEVAAMPDTNDALKIEEQPATPVMEEVRPIEQPIEQPAIVDNGFIPEATIKPEEQFDKTEVLDFSGINKQEPTPSATPFISDNSQYSNDQMLNGEETAQTTPEQTPKW